MQFRIEEDSLGRRKVPAHAYYGVQTVRAMENFQVTGISIAHFPRQIQALAVIKKAAALANQELGLLDDERAQAIAQACRETRSGQFDEHFVVDCLQGGAGTSVNMNANEVICNRALELLGCERGEYSSCHPNNHVNLSQSTNDVYPTSLKLAAIWYGKDLIRALRDLARAFADKGEAFREVIKMGRTQLQDAVPMTLGQEFTAYAVTLDEDVSRLEEGLSLLHEINMGATAIGTGINTDPQYAALVSRILADISGLPVVKSPNLVEATSDTGGFVQFSGVLKRIAVKLSKICNDLRLLSSGPRAGLNEINLPPRQPGSSIMPGKVNPVIPEVVNQICFQVIGNDVTVTMAAEGGQLQLNVFEPVVALNIFQSLAILHNGCVTLREKCVEGITANTERCAAYVDQSTCIVTSLSPAVGHETAAHLAQEALRTGKAIRDLVLEQNLLSPEEVDRLLDPQNMICPQPIAKERAASDEETKSVR